MQRIPTTGTEVYVLKSYWNRIHVGRITDPGDGRRYGSVRIEGHASLTEVSATEIEIVAVPPPA
jgi:hypothetical protein